MNVRIAVMARAYRTPTRLLTPVPSVACLLFRFSQRSLIEVLWTSTSCSMLKVCSGLPLWTFNSGLDGLGNGVAAGWELGVCYVEEHFVDRGEFE